jgi:hypothetical protein
MSIETRFPNGRYFGPEIGRVEIRDGVMYFDDGREPYQLQKDSMIRMLPENESPERE